MAKLIVVFCNFANAPKMTNVARNVTTNAG